MRGAAAPATVLLVCSTRERPRLLLSRAFPRGRAQIHVVRNADGIDHALRTMLVDAIIVDLLPGAAGSVGWRAVEHATRHAPIPAVGLIAPRALDPALLVRLHAAGVTTILIDGVDDAMIRVLLQPVFLTTRFTVRADVLLTSHAVGPLAEAVWRTGVSHVGRLTSVAAVAKQLGLSREHLARTLRAAGAPGAKQLLELVRLLVVQTQLSAGVPVAVAAVRLGYSSVSHLARAARTATGITPRHWGSLTAEGLIEAAVRTARAQLAPSPPLHSATPLPP
jgi:AraC-like DNA-binding protein